MTFNALPLHVVHQHKGKSFTGISVSHTCHDGGKIFLAKRSSLARDEQGSWEPGGGGVKFGETIEQALRRELQEEYGATPLEIHFLGYRDALRTHDGVPTHWLGLDFAVKVHCNDMHINEPQMFDDAGWFTLDDLPTPLHSQMSVVLEKHRDALIGLLRRASQ